MNKLKLSKVIVRKSIKFVVTPILMFLLIYILISGFIFLHSHYVENKIENLAKKSESHTSKVVAYEFQGSDGTDAVKLKDGTQFEVNNLNVGDSNFESKVEFGSHSVKKDKKVTYLKKEESNNKPSYYYIVKMK